LFPDISVRVQRSQKSFFESDGECDDGGTHFLQRPGVISGKILVGDEVHAVNGVTIYNKLPNEVGT
jgi:hypothetical protein